MVEKIYDKIENIQKINQIAAELKRLGMKDELEKLAEKNHIVLQDVEAFLTGKRYFLVDGGNCEKVYETARSKLLDEMLFLKDPMFADVVGNYLLKECSDSELESQILKKHKTLQRCIEFLMEKAWGFVSEDARNRRTNVGIAMQSDTVFHWVKEYYALDDEEQMAQKEKEQEEQFLKRIEPVKKPEKKASGKKAAKKKMALAQKAEAVKKEEITGEVSDPEEDGVQLSLFDSVMTA